MHKIWSEARQRANRVVLLIVQLPRFVTEKLYNLKT
jgi:hypothetical protein